MLFGIRKRQASQVQLNTHFNDLLGCPLALHKLQINPAAISTDTVSA